MSILDKLFGHEDPPKTNPQPQGQYQPPPNQPQPNQAQSNQAMSNDQAIARYQYMLKTAPPETIEQAHQEAFAQLTPEQRRMVLQQLSSTVPPAERPPVTADDPQTLARMATRAEVRQPGTMERLFGGGGPGGGGGGLGMGSVIGGSLLTSLAGGFIGSAIADHFFRGPMGSGFFGGGGGYGGGYGGQPVINETNIYNEGGASDTDTGDTSDVSDDTTDNLTDDSGGDDTSDDSTDYSGDDSGGGDYDSGDSGDYGGGDDSGSIDV